MKGSFSIVRLFEDGRNPVIVKRGLTLPEAVRHCKDANASSRGTSEEARRLTAEAGCDWIDLYTEDREDDA